MVVATEPEDCVATTAAEDRVIARGAADDIVPTGSDGNATGNEDRAVGRSGLSGTRRRSIRWRGSNHRHKEQDSGHRCEPDATHISPLVSLVIIVRAECRLRGFPTNSLYPPSPFHSAIPPRTRTID
jgi:hypothetical protein